jgi:hypothetical protein
MLILDVFSLNHHPNRVNLLTKNNGNKISIYNHICTFHTDLPKFYQGEKDMKDLLRSTRRPSLPPG